MENNLNTNVNNGYVDYNSQPMTIKDWLVTMLVMMIPIINIIMVFVWAFGGGANKSKKTYFQAVLIMILIVFLLWVVLGAGFIALLSSL